MNATIKYSAESLFVDQPNVTIPGIEPTAGATPTASGPMLRRTQPFSDMSRGKFRRLFNRHTVAFRR